MIAHVKRVIRIVLGTFFLLLGLIGIFLPILQGWLFIALAIFTLSRDIRMLAKLESKMTSRFPKTGHFFERMRKAIPLWD